ncbi:MAG: hypothetical protein LBV41_12635 [Cytophagaceae bacterium]|jgi:hypothetical protein|nr:hypothetical protein [Cytophagaceae bacterium]
MKTIIPITALALLCCTCGTTQYVPVETTKIEYQEQIARDSIFRYDFVFVKQ